MTGALRRPPPPPQEELDSTDTSVVISSCSLAEARLLLDNFLKASIDKVGAAGPPGAPPGAAPPARVSEGLRQAREPSRGHPESVAGSRALR